VTGEDVKWHHRPIVWLESLAASPYAVPLLFIVSAIEASLAPIPPDVLLIAMAVTRPRAAVMYALVCAAGSVAGAIAGYVIGASVFESVGGAAIGWLGLDASFQSVLGRYHDHPYWALLASGFANIPFFVFTIAAGYRHTVEFGTFLLAAATGRLVRFLLVGTLLALFGPAVGRFLRRYFPAVSLAALALFLLMIWLAKS
jgi:membrane protein YqaA with SNARE-associated domain